MDDKTTTVKNVTGFDLSDGFLHFNETDVADNTGNYTGVRNGTVFLSASHDDADDLIDTGLTYFQTFILAEIATVMLLLVAAVSILTIGFLWYRQRGRSEECYKGVLQKEESSEPLEKLHEYSLPQELKTSESQFTITPGDGPMTTPPPQLPSTKSNGSIITMTLKNNHLIVETEETTNTPTTLKIESKGTTTKFVTPAGPDFRIESISERASEFREKGDRAERSVFSIGNHGALVHCPPEEPEDELDKGSSNTGLSQSDLSVSSNESQNPSYRYGNQMGYDSGRYGYPEYSGYSMSAQNQFQPYSTGPRDHSAYCRNSVRVERGDSIAGTEPIQNILMSDIQAHEKRVEEERERRYQEEQNVLGQGAGATAGGEASTSILSSQVTTTAQVVAANVHPTDDDAPSRTANE